MTGKLVGDAKDVQVAIDGGPARNVTAGGMENLVLLVLPTQDSAGEKAWQEQADNYVRYYFGSGNGYEILHTAFDRKADKDVSEKDIADCSLVLLGSPAQNRIMGKIADKLPFMYDGEGFDMAGA
jgi:hypothetical protein